MGDERPTANEYGSNDNQNLGATDKRSEPVNEAALIENVPLPNALPTANAPEPPPIEMDAFPPAETLVSVTEPVVEVDASSVNPLAIIVCAALKSPPETEIIVAPEAVIAAKSNVPPNLPASRIKPFSVSMFVSKKRSLTP